jgi:hypothetical protein
MRRFSLALLFALIPALTLSLLLTGCGGKKSDDDDEAPVKSKKKPTRPTNTAPADTLKPVTAKEYGVLTGQVKWTGDKPNLQELTNNLQASMKNDTDYCLTGKTKEGKTNSKHPIQPFETTEQEFRIGDNGNLGNVFVWIMPEQGYYFEIPADQLAKYKDSKVEIEQPHCAFLPHAAVVFPSYYKDGKQHPSGQKFIVKNDAIVSHNSKVAGGPRNPGGNPTLKPGDEETFTLKPDSTPISVACGIHTWMKAYVRAFDHPYAAVTSVGADLKAKKYEDTTSANFGKYEITGVPVGAKVRIYAWHETLGPLNGANGEEITIAKSQEKSFDAKAK